MQMLELKENSNGGTHSPRTAVEGVNPNRPQGTILKLECPTFDGTNPRLWIRKCNRYFHLCKISNETKVELATLYMLENAESWVSSYLANRENVE